VLIFATSAVQMGISGDFHKCCSQWWWPGLHCWTWWGITH